MHRTSAVTRKGLHAAERPVVLDVGRFGRARYQASDLNLVAEPMEAPGRCGCIARTLVLTLLCLLSSVGVFTLLVLTTDGTSPMPTGMRMESEHGQDNSSALLPHDIHEHNDQVAVVEVTTTTSAQQQQRFQMTFTADVLADADGRLRVSLANGSGFFVAYNDDSYIQPVDKQSHGLLHELSEQTLTFVRDSLEAASGEKRQNRRLDEKHQTTTAHPGAAFAQASRVWFTKSAPVRRFGFFLLVSMPPIVMISIVCFMQQGPYRPHPSQHGQPRQHVHQSDAGPPFVGTATLKVPPSWSIERNHIYSLRAWISDLVPWASASDLEAVRHGPIAALQVQGSAVSEGACNELTPHHLQHGDIDPMTGQQLTGLMLLVTVLGRRYAPLEAENVTKSIAEFLSFRRMPGESIDSTLVRFDILRNRAHVRAGFGINWTGLAWLLTQSLQLNAETWDRLLAPLGGQLPAQEFELGGLMERIRRVFHLREGRLSGSHHQGATGDSGNFFSGATPTGGEQFFPTFVPEAGSVLASGGPMPSDPWLGARPSATPSVGPPTGGDIWQDWQPSSAYHAESDVCPTCGTAYFQETGSTDTSSDDGAGSIDVDGLDPTEVYQDYAYARKQWRRVSGRYPRRYRRFGKGSRKGHKGGGYAAFLPPGAFAGGKGGSQGGNKGYLGVKKNPKDKSGQIMRCNICQSDEHLWRRCPQRAEGGKGNSYSSAASLSPAPNAGQPSSNQLALWSGRSVAWGGPSGICRLESSLVFISLVPSSKTSEVFLRRAVSSPVATESVMQTKSRSKKLFAQSRLRHRPVQEAYSSGSHAGAWSSSTCRIVAHCGRSDAAAGRCS